MAQSSSAVSPHYWNLLQGFFLIWNPINISLCGSWIMSSPDIPEFLIHCLYILSTVEISCTFLLLWYLPVFGILVAYVPIRNPLIIVGGLRSVEIGSIRHHNNLSIFWVLIIIACQFFRHIDFGLKQIVFISLKSLDGVDWNLVMTLSMKNGLILHMVALSVKIINL